jgi:hypothetical protein
MRIANKSVAISIVSSLNILVGPEMTLWWEEMGHFKNGAINFNATQLYYREG